MSGDTTSVGTIAAIVAPLAGAISYLAKKLLETVDIERKRGDRLEAELLKLQSTAYSTIEAATSAIREHIALIRDQRR